MSLKRGNSKRDADRKWDGREGGIKQRERLRNQTKALVSLREESRKPFIVGALARTTDALPVSVLFFSFFAAGTFGLLSAGTFLPLRRNENEVFGNEGMQGWESGRRKDVLKKEWEKKKISPNGGCRSLRGGLANQEYW